jgi:hypothetical protein
MRSVIILIRHLLSCCVAWAAVPAVSFAALVPIWNPPPVSSGFSKATVSSAIADPAGVLVRAHYPSCPNKAVRIDLWSDHSGLGNWTIDGMCYSNSVGTTGPDNYCFFRKPHPVGFPRERIRLNVWNVNNSCTEYAGNLGMTTDYGVYNPEGNVTDYHFYRAFTDSPSTLVSVTKSKYALKLDSRGGAIYEYNNRRTGFNPARNAVFPWNGSALQTDLANFVDIMGPQCGSPQLHWNPTQAGSSCGVDSALNVYPSNRPSPTVYCDGVQNNACNSASNSFRASVHQMMNFTYGSGYLGAYNSGDTLHLDSQHAYFDDYFVVTNAFSNVGAARAVRNAEVPTWWTPNSYRRFYYEPNNDGVVTTVNIPMNTTGNSCDNFGNDFGGCVPTANRPNLGQWWTMDDMDATYLGASSPLNNSITVGYFFNAAFLSVFPASYLRVEEDREHHGYKFTALGHYPGTGAGGTIPSGTWFSTKYVIFPYKYNETITITYPWGGGPVTKTVRDHIAAMRSFYNGKNTW